MRRRRRCTARRARQACGSLLRAARRWRPGIRAVRAAANADRRIRRRRRPSERLPVLHSWPRAIRHGQAKSRAKNARLAAHRCFVRCGGVKRPPADEPCNRRGNTRADLPSAGTGPSWWFRTRRKPLRSSGATSRPLRTCLPFTGVATITAALRFVLKAFFGVKLLVAYGERKRTAALFTGYRLVFQGPGLHKSSRPVLSDLCRRESSLGCAAGLPAKSEGLAGGFSRHVKQGGCRNCGIVPLVTPLRMGALFGLLERFGSQHAKADGNARCQLHVHDPPRAFAGHIIEVRRLSAYHDAKRNDRIDSVVRCNDSLCSERQLEAAGHVINGDVFGAYAAFCKGATRTIFEPLRKLLVKARRDDRKAFARAIGWRRALRNVTVSFCHYACASVKRMRFPNGSRSEEHTSELQS